MTSTNAQQIDYWNGRGGEHWVAEQERFDRINVRFGEMVVSTVAAQPGERILDVGCGNGALTLALAPLVGPTGTVTGLDISTPMLGRARRRADEAGLTNVSFEQGDAQIHSLPEATFDAVVSRFGVMFFDDPQAAFSNLRRAVRSGGRLVFVCWQEFLKNEWLIVPIGAALAHVPVPELGPPDQPGPFSLADPDRVRSLLAAAGFGEIELTAVTAPMHLGSSVDDTVAFLRSTDLAETLMADVPEETAEAAWTAVRDALAPHATPEGVTLSGAAWLVTARTPAQDTSTSKDMTPR
jgi:SAM-dependent methyltransferase